MVSYGPILRENTTSVDQKHVYRTIGTLKSCMTEIIYYLKQCEKAECAVSGDALANVLVGLRGFDNHDKTKNALLTAFGENWEMSANVSFRLEDAVSCVVGCASLDSADPVCQRMIHVTNELVDGFDAQRMTADDVCDALWRLKHLRLAAKERREINSKIWRLANFLLLLLYLILCVILI